MIRGRVIAEGLKQGADLRVNELRVVRLGRHDVHASTLPTGEQRDGSVQGAVEHQPTIWTFIDFEAPDAIADELAQALSEVLEPDLGWWADFIIDDCEHVIVFAGRAFRYRIGDEFARAEAVAWGQAAGTPHHQLDWGP
jgi:hypothetical protein